MAKPLSACQIDSLKAVDTEWLGVREIQQRAHRWSNTGVRSALGWLSSQGFIEIRAAPGISGKRKWEYRKLTDAA